MSSAQQTRDIAGRYQLLEALSKRPVGRWFRAHDREVEVDVGLLLVNPELLPDEGSQDRFIGAAVEMKSVNHRHLLKLFDVGREGDSVYLTTQMTQPIRALYKADGVLQYANSVADALDAVHRSGHTHGRLTPVDICEVQRLIKVAGSGLYADVSPTVAMRVWRSLSCFWAPEVIRGERATPAADVYSLAAIAAVLLSSGKSSEPHGALEDLKQENRPVHDALAPALSVSPEKRPVSPSLLVSRLSGALEDDELDEEPTTYFVKSSLDDADDADNLRTVMDLNVPDEVATAEAPPQKPIKNPLERATNSGKASQREVTVNTRAPASRGKEANRSKKKKGLKSHDRTIVERNKRMPGTGAPRKVPAMVEMGAPVGPSNVRTRGKSANRGDGNVPKPVEVNIDATERMDAQIHKLPGGGLPSNVPPTVAAGAGWAARPAQSKSAVKRQPASPAKPNRPTRPAGDASDESANTSSRQPAHSPHAAREPSGRQSAARSERTHASRPGRKPPGPASDPSRASTGTARTPHAAGPKPSATPQRTPFRQHPAPHTPMPQHIAHPPTSKTNVLYIVLAAVISATLAIILTILLFGN